MIDRRAVKVFVGAYDAKHAWVLFTSDSEVDADISDTSHHVDDCLGGGGRPPGDGLWMFEGERIAESDNGYNQISLEFDVYYKGAWRRATDEEAIAASSGENPCSPPCGT
jgi:hypothetical protein